MARTKTNPTQIKGSAFWIPSDPTGATDMAAELEAFVIANAGRKVIVDSSATILLENFGQGATIAPSGTIAYDIDIDFGTATILQSNDAPCVFLDNVGNAGTEYTVSALSNVQLNSASLVTRLTLSAASGVQAHDWVAVYSDDANPSKSGGKMGQIHQVIQDETADPYVYLAGQVGKLASYTTNIKLRKISATRTVSLNGGTWKSNGDTDDLAITTREECIQIRGYVDPRVTNVVFKSPWAQGVWLQCTGGAIVDTYEVKDTLNNAGSNGYSYGVVLYGMNGNATIKNGVVRNGRHPAGTTDGNSGGTSTWYAKGEPTNCAFLNTRGYNCYGSVLDSHEEGCFTVFDGVYVHNSVTDQRAIFNGRAFQGRSFRETLKNVTVYGGTGGISFDDIDHGEEDEVIIENITLMNIKNGAAGGLGIKFEDNAQTNLRHYRMTNVTVDDCDRAVYVGDKNKLTYHNLKVSRSDIVMDVHDGAVVTATGDTVGDFRNSTAAAPSYFFYVRSAAASEPSIRLLKSPIVLKGGNSAPAALFHEVDTTANKNVWHPGIIDFDGGFTATTSKSAGATTFVDLTDINSVAL